MNISWKKGTNIDTDEELLYSANITASGWLNYKFTDNFSVTPYMQYIGERKGKFGNENYTLDSYILLNLNLKYSIDPFTFDCTFNNILNVDYTYPEYVRAKIMDIPGGRERSFRFQISYNLL